MKRLKRGKPFRAFIIAAIITFICGCSDSESGGNNDNNMAPEADIQTVSVLMNESVAILLTASDPDGDDLTYIVDTQPENGTIEGTGPELTYTPGDDFTGSDSFAFHVNDGASDSGTAAVSITVIYDNAAPVAQSRSIVTHSGSQINITLEASDAEGDNLIWILESTPEYGELNAEDIPMVTYTPPVDYAGNVSFTFHVNDGGKDSNTAAVDIRVSSYRIYVDIDAASGGDGFSWDTAFQHPMDAIDASLDGDQIWVAEGRYLRRESGDKILLAMNDGVFLYGGFAGFEAEIVGRDYESNVTTLDGEESVYHVVTGADNAALDGFTVTGGNADNGIDFPHNRGGGMYNENCSDSLVIANCIFTANSADYRGGGIYNDHSSPTITSCAFTSNKTKENGGGGIFNWYSSSIISDCVFTDNEAFSSGGGMMNSFCDSPAITDCTFSGNIAKNNKGGGMYNHSSSTIVIDCQFVENEAKRNVGGGVGNYSGLYDYHDSDQSPTISGCEFRENMAKGPGGGIFFSMCTITIKECRFFQNITGGSGGGIYGSSSSSIITIVDCEFIGNNANGSGGGMHTSLHTITIRDCAFSDNSAGIDGGGLYDHSSHPTITDCEFTNNSADEGGGLYAKNCQIVTICMFRGNSAEDNGGGLCIINNGSTIENCSFIDNTAVNSGGGAICSATFIGCEFSRNSAHAGGGINCGSSDDTKSTIIDCELNENQAYNGGGIYAEARSRLYGQTGIITISSSHFTQNRADNIGGGIYAIYKHYYFSDPEHSIPISLQISGSNFICNQADIGSGLCIDKNVQAEIETCLFTGNHASSAGAVHISNALAYNFDGWTTITNSTFFSNANYSISLGADAQNIVSATNCILWGSQGSEVSDPSIVISYSDIDQDGYAGNNGNINDDPLFISPGFWDDNSTPDDESDDFWVNGNYHLQPGSPCINAGYPDNVDMGAFQYQD